jgi:peptidoglycan-associated lipoprotein
MNKKIVLLLSIFISFLSYSQDSILISAEYESDIRNYSNSIELYKTALKSTKSKWDISMINYRIAECYDDLLKFETAVDYYKKSYKKDKKDIGTLYNIAISLRRNNQYDESNKFIKKYIIKGSHFEKEKGRRILNGNNFAIIKMNNPSNYEVKLNQELSSPFYDFSPNFINTNKSSLIFTSSRLYKDTLYEVGQYFNLFHSVKENGKWSKITPIDTAKNKVNNNGTVTIDNKRNILFFTQCNEGNCNIYYSFLQGKLIGESFPLNFDETIEDSTVFGQPSFSNELDLLFFASDLPGGYGGKDIWYSKYNKLTDSWSKPKNMGAEINTPQDELFPSIDEKGTLYYSSKGGLNLGGLDIFKAIKKDDLSWGDAINLGYPINSSGDEFGIIFNKNLKTGYFTSNRAGGVGKDDIYEFNYNDSIIEKGKELVIDSIANEDNLNAFVEVFNKEVCNSYSESLEVSNLKVFPNPNNGKFTLQFNSNIEEELTIKIYSNLGRIVTDEKYKSSIGLSTKKVDITNHKRGVYYLHISQGCNSLYLEKLIIQ